MHAYCMLICMDTYILSVFQAPVLPDLIVGGALMSDTVHHHSELTPSKNGREDSALGPHGR